MRAQRPPASKRRQAVTDLRHLRRSVTGVLILLLTVLAAGCSPVYVLRAGFEEAKILWRRQPITAVLRRPDLDPSTRAKLELVLAVRTFAADQLKLNTGRSYTTFARVDSGEVVHVLSAARRLRLEPYTWWFPIVGRVPYKGFFSKAAADAAALRLQGDGYDTYVRPAAAFSTLGWFADPLVSSLLRYDRITLADIIIHELLHNTAYIGGDADFDESFANFVGHRGAILFFEEGRDEVAARAAQAEWHDALRFSEFLDTFVGQLRTFYQSAGATIGERQRLFTRAQSQLRGLDWQADEYREFGVEPLNNAVILHYLLYADRLELFENVYHRERDDLARTIQVVLATVANRGGDPFEALEHAGGTVQQAAIQPPQRRGLHPAEPAPTGHVHTTACVRPLSSTIRTASRADR